MSPMHGSTNRFATIRTVLSELSAMRSISIGTFTTIKAPRPLEAIEADIKAVEHDVLKLLNEVTG